jgi:hypothetical protein
MIEIKKPGGAGGVQYTTLYKDFVAEGVDFTTLNTVPYKILDAQGANICITPVNLIIDYISTGVTTWSFAISSFTAILNNLPSAFFTFFGNGTQTVLNNRIIVTGINSQSQNCGTNQYINENVYLWNTFADEPSAAFSRFKIYMTYYLTPLI